MDDTSGRELIDDRKFAVEMASEIIKFNDVDLVLKGADKIMKFISGELKP